jgi:hypothetical protein
MSNSRTFSSVTPAVLERMRATNDSPYTMKLNSDGKSGTVSGKSPLGDVVIGFDYAEAQAEVTMTILEKPMFVPVPLLWAEFSYALRCATQELRSAVELEHDRFRLTRYPAA